uniref:Uncharacterized protein n=1 Tax=Picea sitchensis TaxID=3332 RepID=A0A6B9XTB7_PICSI|nr:hypothetical protein Q903MT_gene4306 [Picea sitchensis]
MLGPNYERRAYFPVIPSTHWCCLVRSIGKPVLRSAISEFLNNYAANHTFMLGCLVRLSLPELHFSHPQAIKERSQGRKEVVPNIIYFCRS